MPCIHTHVQKGPVSSMYAHAEGTYVFMYLCKHWPIYACVYRYTQPGTHLSTGTAVPSWEYTQTETERWDRQKASNGSALGTDPAPKLGQGVEIKQPISTTLPEAHMAGFPAGWLAADWPGLPLHPLPPACPSLPLFFLQD